MHGRPVRNAAAYDESAEAFAELVGVIDRLDGLGEQLAAASRPSQQWHDATRRRLMAVAAEEGIGVTARHRASAAVPETGRAPITDDMFPKRPRGGRRIAIVAALLTGTVAVSGVSAASGDALPGDTLYNVKRSTEKAQLALAGNDIGKAQLYLEFARTRIQEAAEVTDDEAAVANALSDAAGELRSGTAILGEVAVADADASPLDYVDLFTNEHRWVLEDLVSGLDGEALTAGEELVAVLEGAAVRSVELREALDCTEPGGPSDELGPVPATCTKDNRDTTSPAQPGSPEDAESSRTENGENAASESSEPDSGEAAETPREGGPSGEATDAPMADPTTGGAGTPTTNSDPSPTAEDKDALGELTGIISDLFN